MEDYLRFLIEENTDGIFSLDPSGKFNSVNSGLIEITETSQEDLLEMNLWSFCTPEDREEISLWFKKALSGVPQKFEKTFLTAKGRKTILEITLSATDANGVWGIAKDHTKLRKAEFALEESAKRFGALIRQGSDIISILDSDGTFKCVSENSYSVLGLKPQHFIDVSVFDFIHPEDKETLQREFEDLKRNGEPKEQVFRIRNQDGDWRWMEAKARDLRQDASIGGIVVNTRDITEQFMSRLVLEESEQKYRAFFQNSLDGILLTAPTGEIFAANPAACEIFQMSEDELCRKGRSGIVDLSDPRLNAAIEERHKSGKTVSEITMIRKDGSKFPAEVSSAAFEERGGKMRASIIIRDISEKKIAEEKLKASQKQYQLLFRNNPLPNWIYDRSSLKILNVNEAAVNHYGYSREELLQMKITDLRPKKEVPELENFLEKWKDEDGVAMFGSAVHMKKNKELIKVEVSGYHLRYREKDCTMVVCNDVTERDKIFQKLETKREKLLAAQKIAGLGSWEIDLSTTRFSWTEEVFRIWDQREGIFEPTFENIYKTIHPNDLGQFKTVLQASMSGEAALNIEFRINIPNGSEKWIQARGNLLYGEVGRSPNLEGTFQDVTERKTYEENLRASEARFRGIIESQTNYLTRIDLEGNYTYVNQKFSEDFSWIFPDQNPMGKSAKETIVKDHQQKAADAFELWISDPDTVHQIELDKLQKDGSTKSTLWDFVCLTDSEGHPLEMQGVGIDITERVKAENLLLESNERYEIVSKATLDAIYDWDCRTGSIFWSEGYDKLNGAPGVSSAPGNIDDWANSIHPEDSKVISDLHTTLKGTDTNWESEYRFQRANGESAHVTERGFIIRDEQNQAIRMVGAIRDVTDKKKLEDLLDKASRLARIGSYENDLISESLYWSPVTREILEVPRHMNLNPEHGIVYYKEGEHRDKMEEAFCLAVEKNIPFDIESIIVTGKGKECWVRTIGQPEFINGKCVRISGSFQDIDSIKRAQQKAIKASEEKDLILESIGDAFFAVDNQWVVTYFNKKAEELLQCPKDEILGKNAWEIFPDAINTDFYRLYNKAFEESTVQNFEEYLERVNKWFDVSVYPSPNGLSVYFRDVTERKKSSLELLQLNEDLKSYTKELLRANSGLEQFSYIVSHNLRSPVANILGLANLLEDEQYPQDLRRELEKELFNSVGKLDNVIKDLNTILELKKDITTKKETVGLEELVLSIRSSIKGLIQKEQVEIITDFVEVPEIRSVPSYLHSIFYNLITNSIKYRRPGIPPVVTITGTNSEGRTILIFKDNGLGLDLEKRGNQVFGLYKRFHSHVEGKGIGLFMVKSQVEALGGKIEVRSELNKGTEFIIELQQNSVYKEKNENKIPCC